MDKRGKGDERGIYNDGIRTEIPPEKCQRPILARRNLDSPTILQITIDVWWSDRMCLQWSRL